MKRGGPHGSTWPPNQRAATAHPLGARHRFDFVRLVASPLRGNVASTPGRASSLPTVGMASSLLPLGAVRRIGAILRALMLDGAKEVPPAAEIGGGTAEHRLDWSQPWISGVTRGRLRRIVTRALALTPRGFIPHDVPRLNKLSAQLRVEWLTRDIHPWDRVLPLRRRAELFRDQASRDTDAAISRLFQILPDLAAIEIRVLEPHSPNRLVFAGTVVREDVLAARSVASPGMRLKLMGIRSHTTDGHLEPPD